MLKFLDILGWLWALPMTLIGLLIVVFGNAQLVRTDDDRTLHFLAKEGGLCSLFFKKFKMAAFTWGFVIVYKTMEYAVNQRLIRHEKAHTRQCMKFGIFMIPTYVVLSLVAIIRGKNWHKDNWLEQQARDAED